MLNFKSDDDFAEKLDPVVSLIKAFGSQGTQDTYVHTYLEEIFKILEFAPAQIKAAVTFIAAALETGTVEDLLEQRNKLVGKWEHLESSGTLSTGLKSNLVRYWFQESFVFETGNRAFDAYVAPTYVPFAGSTYSAGPVSSKNGGVFLPGSTEQNGGFRLLLCWSSSERYREILVRRSYVNELIIDRQEFKRGS